MTFTKKAIHWLWIAAGAASFLMVAWPAEAYTDLDAERASALLAEAKTESFQLKQDASEMASFNQSALSWETHADKLREIKEHVNQVGEIVAQLKLARPGAAPWQQVAIDRVYPLMEELALNVQGTIGHLRIDPEHLQDPWYKEYLTTTAELASKISALVADFADYGEAKGKLVKLSEKLKIAER